MSVTLAAPAASATPEEHADWLELLALRAKDKNSSVQDLVKEFRHSGSTDALSDEASIEEFTDTGSERSHQIAEEAHNEISDRHRACGMPTSNYSFHVGEQYIQAQPKYESAVYTFLLLLSNLGKDAGPNDIQAVDLFNRLSAHAAREYIGGHQKAQLFLFDFPRRHTPPGFKDAVDELCKRMGEGTEHKERPNIGDQKDSKLDVVVWREFDDGRRGKLIGFGQCSTGGNWHQKLSELQPDSFIAQWMYEPIRPTPIRMFFTPFRVERDRWEVTTYAAGIIFDRCRIAELTGAIGTDLQDLCRRWSKAVIREYLS